MKPSVCALVATLAASAALPAAPRLVVSTPSLAPESEVDVVFDSAVVKPEEVGKTAPNSWLRTVPPLQGVILWKAPNIAGFIPESPPSIATNYSFFIPRGKKHLDGTPVPDGMITSLPTEPFRLMHSDDRGSRWSGEYSASTSEWILVFNDDVDPERANPFVFYVSEDGKRVAASLKLTEAGKAGYYGTSTPSWSTRAAGKAGEGAADSQETTGEALLSHVLTAKPMSPLPPAKGWHLAILKGLRNKGRGAALAEDFSIRIGDIHPFAVAKCKALTIANQPRRIVIEFNHALAERLAPGFLESSELIIPRPENLTAEVRGKNIVLGGDLGEHNKYQINISAHGLLSRDGFPLAGAFSGGAEFRHLEPMASLPSGDAGQLASGARRYRFLTQNLASAEVRVKQLAGTTLVRAVQGYRHVSGDGPDHRSISPNAPLPYELIDAAETARRSFRFDNPVDTTRVTEFGWDELLPKGSSRGTFFLHIEGKPHPFLEQRDGAIVNQAIVQLTDIGLAWKLTGAESVMYAFSCTTGGPLEGVKLTLYGEDAREMAAAVTDAAGLARLPRGKDARHLLAALGDDHYVTAFDEALDTVGLWHFPVRYSWKPPAENTRKLMMFTDRSVYRPGETVHIKGVLRALSGNRLSSPALPAARLSIIDPTEKEVAGMPVTFSANGSFDITHRLGGGQTGTHEIRLEFPDDLARVPAEADQESEMGWAEREQLLDNARFSISLRVEEFRRNAFEVTLKAAGAPLGATEVNAVVSAKYYQGQPVAAGSVKHFARIREVNPYPERFRDFLFGNHRREDYGYWQHYFHSPEDPDQGDDGEGDDFSGGRETKTLQGLANLSTSGEAPFSVTLPASDFPARRHISLSADVTDTNHQTLTATTTVVVDPAAVFIGVSRVDRLVSAGEPLPLRIVAVDGSGHPFGEALKLETFLDRETNLPFKGLNGRGETTTVNQRGTERVSAGSFVLDPAASAKEGQTFTVTPQKTGLHFFTVRGTDAQGRTFATVVGFHVYGTNEYPWEYEDGLRIKLIGERKSWKPGETARVLVLSPIEGTALVTVEREKVLRTFRTELRLANPVIEIPLGHEDSPNVYVSVLVVKGARDSARKFKEPQLRLGYCELPVESVRDRLAVSFDSGPESHRPGDEAEVGGTVLLSDGTPAAGAEVTLYAEDEGTLAVCGYRTPDPMSFFHAPRFLTVDSGVSFSTFLPEDPEMLSFHNKGFFVGGGDGGEGWRDEPRRDFNPCAFWQPALVTDAKGRFRHRFRLPDTVTRYRLIAVVHHGTSAFGSAEGSIVAKKDLMLEPKAPRIAHQGDRIRPSLLVQNASRWAGTWEIGYLAHARPGTPVCRASGETVVRVSLAPGGSATIDFPTVVETTGPVAMQWKATPVSLQNGALDDDLVRQLSDSVEVAFEARYPVPELKQVKLVKLQPGKEGTDLLSLLDRNLVAGDGEVEIDLCRSPLVEAAGSVDYLLQYPYGCVEQTTSALLPWCSVGDLKDLVPAFSKVPAETVSASLQAGVDRLVTMQLPGGGFSYWQGDAEVCDWASPYAGLALLTARARGAMVPQGAADSLTQYLLGSLRGIGNTRSAAALESHALSLYVLAMAGTPQPAYHNTMIDRIGFLTPKARHLLAAAIACGERGDKQAARAVLSSDAPVRITYDGWMEGDAAAAQKLLAWALVDPAAPETTAALDRLLKERNPYGHWGSTWVNGWTLLALAECARAERDLAGPARVIVQGPEGSEEIVVSREQPAAARRFPLAAGLKLGASAAEGTAYARVRITARPPIVPLKPVARNGLSIDRIHQKVLADGTTEPLSEPEAGDLVKVTLRVTLPRDDTRYLVIDDPLPALFEAVNTGFGSQRGSVAVTTSANDWNVSHSELRGDRAVFFLDHIAKGGTYTLSYLVRCTVAGAAMVPPAKVESMYEPDQFALSDSRVFTTR
jgi:uncharacterized protein YfaS (alpha-2-macroglobulin family)